MDNTINKFEGKTLHMMVGLPRSGKGTFARKLSKEIGAPIVDPDCFRLSIHGDPFHHQTEPLVWAIVKHAVEALFLAGHDVVILDCVNHTRFRRNQWKSKNWTCQYHFIDTPIDVCIERAKATGQEYLVPIIQRMHKEAEWP
jgi:predicted kinase